MKLKPIILGDEAAVKLLAVEGLHLTPAYRSRIDALRDKGLTTDEIRQIILTEFNPRKAA